MLDSTVIGRDINIIINFFLQFLEIECFCRSLQFRLFKRRVAITRVKVRENGQQKTCLSFKLPRGTSLGMWELFIVVLHETSLSRLNHPQSSLIISIWQLMSRDNLETHWGRVSYNTEKKND